MIRSHSLKQFRNGNTDKWQCRSRNHDHNYIILVLPRTNNLLLHPDLDGGCGVPGDQVVAGDDLVRAIGVFRAIVLRHHARAGHQLSQTIIFTLCLLATTTKLVLATVVTCVPPLPAARLR